MLSFLHPFIKFALMRAFFLHILTFLWVFAAWSQETPRVINFTKNDYKAQNQNWAITQSPDNELFIGNGDGLLSYDGSFWRLLALPNRQIIRSVACDSAGRIFTGGFAEFGFWERDHYGAYKYHSLSEKVPLDRFKREEIWHILVHGTSVYFQSFSAIYRYDYHKVTALKLPSNIMFLKPVHGKLYIQGLEKGLYELANDSFHFIKNSEFLAKKNVSTILPYQNGLLIGTARDGFFIYENNAFRAWSSAAQAISKNFQLNNGVRLSNGNYAFGTILNGVYILNTEGGALYHINKENGLQNNTVIALFEDRAKNLWLGLDKGIDLIDLNTPLTFFQDKTGHIGAVYAAAIFNGRFYVGTNQGVFYKSETDKFTLLQGTQGQVWDLQEIDNQLFIGHNSGTFILTKNNELKKITDITGGWMLKRHPSVENVLVQGTYTGLALFKKNDKNEWFFWKKIGNLSEPIKKIAFDKSGNLWALNPYGQVFKGRFNENLDLIALNDSSNSVVMKNMSLPVAGKADFSKIRDDYIIFKVENHYFVFDSDKGIFNEIKNSEFQRGKPFKGIGNDYFLIFNDYIHFNSDNLSQSLRLKLIPNYETIVALDSTRYLFGLDDGYAIFDKTQTANFNNYHPQMIVRLIAKDGTSYHFYPFKNKYSTFELPPQLRSLRAEFSLPVFTENSQFQYCLDDNCSDWENINVHEWANLSAGTHTITLKNNLNNKNAELFFEIQPYLYETIWAKIFYIILLLCLAYFLFKYHTKQLKKQRLLLEAEKLKELEQERIRADNEKLHADILTKSRELANSTMGIIRKNEILMDIKEELDTMKSEIGARASDRHFNRLNQMIENNLSSEENWKLFEENFNEVHEDFLKRLKHDFPDLTPGDLKLAAYLRMNLTSKEISPLLYISLRGVENKRYRLRKKLGLSEEDNLTEFIIGY